MKLVAIAALGLGVQNFGVEADKMVSFECSKGVCVVKGSGDKTYILSDDSLKAIHEALKNKDFKISDSKLSGTVKINGKSVDLSFEQQKAPEKKADPTPAQPKK
ncbi:MAG: hypothetical protein K2X28_05075 [Alphaproteobacteria bacterium]|nr:hypothetical protein [Alphaproteobacteria bacterium]